MLEIHCFGKHLFFASSFFLATRSYWIFQVTFTFALLFSKSIHTHTIPALVPTLQGKYTRKVLSVLQIKKLRWASEWRNLHYSLLDCSPPNPIRHQHLWILAPSCSFPVTGLARVLRVSCLDHYTSLPYLIWVVCDTSSFHLTPPSIYMENRFALWSLKSPNMTWYSHHRPKPTP